MQKITNLIKQYSNNNIIYIPDNIIFNLSNEEINFIVNDFGGKYMFKLPQPEINFFEWLKINDPDIWNDIWKNECDCNCHDDDSCDDGNCEHHYHESYADEPYTISINLLPLITDQNRRGFPICDLMNNDNYYFHIDNMVDEESKIIIDVATELFKNNQKLTNAQLLALEISFAPIDIWHFAYKHKISIQNAKQAVQELINDNALVHITQAEYLLPFLPF